MLQDKDFQNRSGSGNYSQEEWRVRVELAAMFRLTAHFGWDDTVWNHITARVPGEQSSFLMNRFGLLYREVNASNMIKVDEHGVVIDGPPNVNIAGFVIQSAIHARHPENKYVFHAHPPQALAATVFKDGLPFLVQDSAMLYGKIGYHTWEGESVELEERHRIAENLGENKCLVMRNHGFLTVGSTAGEAFMNMYYLIRMCQVALQAYGSGLELDPAPQAIWEKAARQYEAFPPGKYEWEALMRVCDRIDPSYKT